MRDLTLLGLCGSASHRELQFAKLIGTAAAKSFGASAIYPRGDLNLPLFNEDVGGAGHAAGRDAPERAGSKPPMPWSSPAPEYNKAPPGVLKNALRTGLAGRSSLGQTSRWHW